MYCLRVNETSPRQVPMYILTSLASNLPFVLVSLLVCIDQKLTRAALSSLSHPSIYRSISSVIFPLGQTAGNSIRVKL